MKSELPTMTADEFRHIRATLGKSQAEMASTMGVNLRTVQKWEGEERAIPGPAVVLAKFLVEKRMQEAS